MKIEVQVPQLPESVSEATLLCWHKQEGDYVKRDENLIDLETDKVVLEIPAPQAGRISRIFLSEGATCVSGERLAEIDTSAADEAGSVDATSAGKKPDEARSAGSEGAALAAEPTPQKTSDQSTASPPAASQWAMPSALKRASDLGVDLEELHGSGRDGRILKEDVERAAARSSSDIALQSRDEPSQADPKTANAQSAPMSNNASSAGTSSKPAVSGGARPEQRVPMTRLRQRIAERLVQSQTDAAILTTFNELNMQPVLDLRQKYKEKFEKVHGVKLGLMSFFVKAAVYALKQFPIVNASVDGRDIVYHGYFDIGIAVGSSRGLVVPILRNADQLSLADIEKKIVEFGQKAQDGKLTVEELSGGTFTISNGGTFGSMMSTPIINPPQSAILGMHATKDRPVVEKGAIEIRPMMYLAFSYDHRIIDGREAVLTLSTIKDVLEEPARMLFDF